MLIILLIWCVLSVVAAVGIGAWLGRGHRSDQYPEWFQRFWDGR